MSVRLVGDLCAREGCRRPMYSDCLCAPCWRLARFFGKHPLFFAEEPLKVNPKKEPLPMNVPWEDWEWMARRHGSSIADLFDELVDEES